MESRSNPPRFIFNSYSETPCVVAILKVFVVLLLFWLQYVVNVVMMSSTTRGSEEDGAGGSELVYSPHSELDYGTFLCFAENSIGRWVRVNTVLGLIGLNIMECQNTTTSDNAYLKGNALYNPAAAIWTSWTTIGLRCLPSDLLLVNGDHRGLKSDLIKKSQRGT